MKRIVFDGSGNLQSVVDFASNIGDVNGGPVAIELGPDGLLYYVVFTTGEIARIRHTSGSGSNFPPFAVAAASPPNGYSPLNVGFSSAGSLDPEGGRADLSVGVWGWRHLHGAQSVSYLYRRRRHDVSGALDRDGPSRRDIHGRPEGRGGQHAPGRHHRPAGHRGPIYGGPDGHLSRVGHRPR